jgi:glycosyltransferase involved in cell wall biosynthesis
MRPMRSSSIGSKVPDLCVVAPAHDEAANLPVLVHELLAVMGDAGVEINILLVDDGSSDQTTDVIRQLVQDHEQVQGLILTRNFGHQAAISTGLRHACGHAIAVMDADLQDKPVDLLALYRRWQAGADVVYAVRRSRRESLLKRTAYRAFYRIVARVANIPIPVDSGDFCVMGAKFVAQLNHLPERLRYVRGLRAWLGGRQVAVPVDRDARRAGVPQYTLFKLFRLAAEGLVSFSYVPLQLASIAGFVISGLAFLGVLTVLVWKLMGLLPSGAATATIALSVLFLGGFQLLTIGILGEYVGRIFDEVKRRPVAMVAELVKHENGVTDADVFDRHAANYNATVDAAIPASTHIT